MDSSRHIDSVSEHLCILVLCMAALGGAFVLEPAGAVGLQFSTPILGTTVSLPDACMSRRLLGISCPGCGLTRSFVYMAHGSARQAFRVNPMGPVLFAICWLQIPYRIIELSRGWTHSRVWATVRRLGEVGVWLIAGGLVAAWVVRILCAN